MMRFFSCERNQRDIIAPGRSGNKLEIVEWRLVFENFDDQYVCHNRTRFPQDAQKGRSARPLPMKAPEA